MNFYGGGWRPSDRHYLQGCGVLECITGRDVREENFIQKLENDH